MVRLCAMSQFTRVCRNVIMFFNIAIVNVNVTAYTNAPRLRSIQLCLFFSFHDTSPPPPPPNRLLSKDFGRHSAVNF